MKIQFAIVRSENVNYLCYKVDDVYVNASNPMITFTVGEDEFEIVAIDFFPLVDNYCVKIVYMKSNGKTGSLAISDFEY